MAKTNHGTKVEFLGGNNEHRIGASSILLEHSEKNKPTARILIDNGAMFPPDWVGYDSAIPDMRDYFDNPYGSASKPVDAMFITHCHEDHIGGLVFLAAAKFKLPKIYTSEFTANFIKQQMKNNNVPEEFIPEIEVVRQGERVDIGNNMQVSPFNISHSTASALGFHVGTTIDGKDNAGLVFTGDYHLDKVPFGQGFDEDLYKKFISDKFISHIFIDSTSASADLVDENGERQIPDFNQAVENTLREVQKHKDKQIFSPVIARSVQNLAIDIRVAALTGRTVLIGSRGLRDAAKDLISIVQNKDKWIKEKLKSIKENPLAEENKDYLRHADSLAFDSKTRKITKVVYNEELLLEDLRQSANAVTNLMQISPTEKIDLEKVIFSADDIAHSDIEKYLNKYPPEQRYMIISGAFAEDKDGRKSCLVLMSEQNKASVGKDGKIKGKGQTGHPLFTVDSKTLITLRQRPIESINGPKHRAVVARLQSIGAVVIVNGDSVDTKYQRTGHATKEEVKKFHKLTVENCKNAKDIAEGKNEIMNIAVHGDPEQLSALLKVLHEQPGKPLLCFNSDVLIVTPEGTHKEKGIPFEKQHWICVQAKSITGTGSNDLFIFDLCDHNLMLQEHLFTVLNARAKKREGINADYIMHKMIEAAEKLEQEEGMSASNIEIRFKRQSKTAQREWQILSR